MRLTGFPVSLESLQEELLLPFSVLRPPRNCAVDGEADSLPGQAG
jgi:hypothetical protein